MTDNDEDDTGPAICGACDGTGESGRFGQLVCRPCRGSGEVFDATAEDDADDYDWDMLIDRARDDAREDQP